MGPDRTGIELATPGSAVRHASVARHVTDCATRPGKSDVLVKNELCIPLERGTNVLSTGEGFNCLSLPSKLKVALLLCSIYKKTISFSAIIVL